MRLMRTFLFVIPILVGCGGSAKVVLKSPVESKCSSSGLKGCPELTEGVLVYVDGDEPKGKEMLVKGAAANAPADVKKFAKALKQLKKVPGAEPYTKKIVEIASILAAEAKKAAPAGAAGGAPDNDMEEDDFPGGRPPPPPGPPPGVRR
jgi:hypothetical protein